MVSRAVGERAGLRNRPAVSADFDPFLEGGDFL